MWASYPYADDLSLPASVTSRVEMAPLEDLLLATLREALPDVPIYALIPFDQFPIDDFFIQVRRITGQGYWSGDDRFIDSGGIAVHVFAKGPNADQVAALVSEAVRVALRDAARNRRWFPGLGGLIKVRLDDEPVRKTDWATSSGPVQFADLPAGYQRYETRYSVWVRKPLT